MGWIQMRVLQTGPILAAGLLLAACGGGGSSNNAGPAPTYTVSATVSGLTGTGLVLQDNGGDNLAVAANGTFAFATSLANGAQYAVTVGTQPTGQTCTVSSGTGTISGANVTNVAVSCSAKKYTIGGSVSGVTGSGLVLMDNGGDSLPVPAGASSFTFPTALGTGAAYAVTVGTPPSGESCSVTNGSGTVASANVTNVSVSCGSGQKVNVTVNGLSGTGLVLQDNGTDTLPITQNGSTSFATALNVGQPYAVTVMAQPATPAQYCTVTGGSGTVSSSAINAVVACRTTGSSIYVTTTYGSSNGVISHFNIDPATGLLNRDSRYKTTAAQPLGVAQDSHFNAYVAYQDATTIESVTEDGNPLAIVHESAVTANGNATYALTLDPTAAYLFAGGSVDTNNQCNTTDTGVLLNYSITDPNGTLSSLGAGYSLDGNPCAVVTDPQGKFLFVAEPRTAEVVAYSINATDGSLTELNGGAPFMFQGGAGVNAPYALAVHPTAQYLFVTDSTANKVSVYSYDPTTAAISLVGSPYAVGNAPESVTVDPTGQFLYVANSGDGTVSAFTISSAGALTPVTGSPFDTGQGASPNTPTAVAVEPSGQYLYVADGDSANVSIFSIAPSSGALTQVGTASSCPSGDNCTVGNYGGTGASALAIQ